MPGPNSAPNGDRRLVTGYRGYHVKKITIYVDGVKIFKWIPLRDWLAQRNQLDTGKTRA